MFVKSCNYWHFVNGIYSNLELCVVACVLSILVVLPNAIVVCEKCLKLRFFAKGKS